FNGCGCRGGGLSGRLPRYPARRVGKRMPAIPPVSYSKADAARCTPAVLPVFRTMSGNVRRLGRNRRAMKSLLGFAGYGTDIASHKYGTARREYRTAKVEAPRRCGGETNYQKARRAGTGDHIAGGSPLVSRRGAGPRASLLWIPTARVYVLLLSPSIRLLLSAAVCLLSTELLLGVASSPMASSRLGLRQRELMPAD